MDKRQTGALLDRISRLETDFMVKHLVLKQHLATV